MKVALPDALEVLDFSRHSEYKGTAHAPEVRMPNVCDYTLTTTAKAVNDVFIVHAPKCAQATVRGQLTFGDSVARLRT